MEKRVPPGWRTIKLKHVCREITVGHVGPMANEYVEEGLPFLRSQNILAFRLEMTGLKYISKEFHKRLKKSVVRAGDVVVVRTGYPGTACVVPSTLGEANCADLVVIRPTSELDPWFAASLFNSTWGRATVGGKLVGVAQQHFNIGAAKEMTIRLPQVDIQRKISSILRAHDDLIENNTRRIRILEEVAQGIYREWFVHFRFPGHKKVKLVPSPLGPIPEGWEVTHVAEAFEICGGATPSTKNPEYWENGHVVWFSPSDLTAANAMFMLDSAKKITDLGLESCSARLFAAYSVMLTSRATIGVVSLNTTPACTNQGFITCLPNERVSAYHIYFWLRENKEKIISLASGATFKEISKATFRQMPFMLPPQPIASRLTETLAPLAKNIEILLRKNVNLRKTRDYLLPKLISGELDVSDLDINVGDAAA